MPSTTIEKQKLGNQAFIEKQKETIFVISGMADVDIAANQSMKNTLKYLSEFGYVLHVFAAFPQDYRILQDPKKIFNANVIYHRSPNFLTPLFDFAKYVKDLFGRTSQKTVHQEQKLLPSQKSQYYDEYNFFGRMIFALFLFLYVPIEIVRVVIYYVKLKPKLFYGINAQGATVASLLGKVLHVPAVQRWHGISYTEEDVAKMKTSFRHKLLLLDGGFAKLMPSDAVIVTNDGTRGDEIYPLLNVDTKKLHFWRNGLDVHDIQLPPNWNKEVFKKSLGLEGKKIILTASRLVLWKRVDRAIDGFHRLITKYGINDAVLVIVGHGREEVKLKQMAKELGIEHAVKFAGGVPHAMIAQYYSSADVFVSLYEISNLGNPLLEAMYFQLPIISLYDAGSSQLLKNNESAYLLQCETIEQDLPEKLNTLLADASLRKTFGDNARRSFDQNILSWKDRMRKEDDLIQRLIREREPHEFKFTDREIPEKELPSVTLIVPCRNEERYIRECLDSILKHDYPQDRVEILVVDGLSEDKTQDIVKEYTAKHPEFRLLQNPGRNVCAGMNVGIAEAKGEVLFKIDAHSTYERDYISRCVKGLLNTGADNVGGKFAIEPGADTPMAKGIALAMGHAFGIGRYYQWIHSLQKPTEVETVSFGCFKKSMLAEKQLSFNEALSRGGDSEFNRRLREKGGRIVLIPEIVLKYFARPDLKSLWKHQFSCSYWVVYWTRYGCTLTFRSFLPMLFVLGFAGLFLMSPFHPFFSGLFTILAVSYLALSFGFSWQIAQNEKDRHLFFLMPLVFAAIHFARGCGAIYGLWRVNVDRA